MGFYGNITNTARTQFQFDKVYPNRYEMEQKTNIDGVYAGRYCLIEYDSEVHTDTMTRVWIFDNQYYTVNKKDATALLTKGTTAEGTIVFTAETNNAPEDNIYNINICKFYVCTSKLVTDSSEPAEFKAIADGLNAPAYTINYNIDTEAFKISRGYDSTVWQKVYTEGNEKYVMIAELNTVVPKFDVSPDAPTMSPIVPHFDTQSTDVYYKLHWQAPWGFRIKEADASQSDETTVYTVTTYDPETGTNTTSITNNIPAAIYYNDAGFAAQVDVNRTSAEGINKHSTTVVEDEIKVEPTGKSGNKYNDHKGQFTQSEQVDIQEMTINLPSIGNMMSDAWDIIHGPRRNDDMREIDPETGDYVASLKGRLDSIDAIAGDEIPVKRHDNGQLIGSKVNGGKADEDDKTGINDDAWIETVVDAATNTISIHHKFNRTKNGNTFTDLREADDWGHNTTDSIDMNDEEDSFDIITPIVDDMGHIVGENTQTVTLPYGFKTIKTNGRSDEVAENATGTPVATNIVADNTKDELAINSGNKWIRIDTDATNDSVTIRHDVHKTSTSADTTDWTKTELNTTIPVPTYSFDEAGHYVSTHTESYQLPFGYGKIKGDSGNTTATATYDEVTFTSDEWLTATVSKDKITYSHDYPKKVDDTESESDVNGNGDTIVLETLVRDEKGHVTKVNQNTVTLPFGYKTFTGDTGSTSANNTQDSMSVTGDSWVQTTVSNDKIAFAHIGPVSGTTTEVSAETPAFGATFSIDDHYFDDKGHKFASKSHTVKIPLPSLTNGTGNVVTRIALTDATKGAFTETRANVGTLAMTGYAKPTTLSNQALLATESLNTALGKLEYRLEKEVSDRTKSINDLDYSDTAVTDNYVSEVSEVDGIISVKRVALPTLQTGTANGTVKLSNGTNVDVYGLKSAAYTESSAYATAAQGTKADGAVQEAKKFKCGEEEKTIAELFELVASLQEELIQLKAKVETEHPTTQVEPETIE